MRPKFRETLWFKKGVKDAEAAQEADPHDIMAPKAVDMMPIEDRYDDGAEPVNLVDSVAFGVHTGKTEYMPKLEAGEPAPLAEADGVNEGLIVRDLKAGRKRVFAAIGLGAALVVAAVIMVAAS
ncbi:hypothetical protein BH11MYX1_BH11MYX1_52690 [soil metagenome]